MSSSCSQEKKYYVNTVGTDIIVEVGEKLSTATSLILRVKKPNGTLVNWIGTQEGLTKIKYTVQSGDWDQAGVYYVQAYVKFPSWTGLGQTTNFEVFAAFK